jgi:hypothetical protein
VLRVGGKAKRKEQNAERETTLFLMNVFQRFFALCTLPVAL